MFLNVLAQVATGDPNYSDIHPDAGALPGGNVAQSMLGGLMYYGLLFTVAGVVISAGIWAVGSFSQNYSQSVNGKRMFLVCAGAAFFIGAAWFLVGWFYGQGTQVS